MATINMETFESIYESYICFSGKGKADIELEPEFYFIQKQNKKIEGTDEHK